MTRRLHLVALGLSLALLAVTVLFWARSYWRGDYVTGYDTPKLFEFYSSSGLIRLFGGSLVSRDYPPTEGWEGTFWPFHCVTDSFQADFAKETAFGFGFERWQRNTPTLQADSLVITLPYWSLALLFSLLPIAWLVSLWRRRRSPPGFAVERAGAETQPTPPTFAPTGLPSHRPAQRPGSSVVRMTKP